MSTALPIGHDLDREVAKRVMGWGVARLSIGERHVDGDVDFTAIMNSQYVYSGPTYVLPEWAPSEVIGHAWQVLDHLHARGYGSVVGYIEMTNGVWKPATNPTCSIWKLGNPDEPWDAGGDTAAHAICLAALAAVDAG